MQKIQTLCDLCHAEHAEEIEASRQGVPIAIGTNVIIVDLCEPHQLMLENTLNPFFLAGRRPDAIVAPPKLSKSGGKKPPAEGDYTCPVTGCIRSFTSMQGLAMHKTRKHLIPGVQSHGQEAHDQAVERASGELVVAGDLSVVESSNSPVKSTRKR